MEEIELLSYFDSVSLTDDVEGTKENLSMDENKEELQVENDAENLGFETEAEVEDENVTMEAEEEVEEEEMAEEEGEEEEMAEEEGEEEEMAEEEGEEEEMAEEEGEEETSFMDSLMGLFGVNELDETELFATISDRIAELESENAELTSYKADVEQKRFDYDVDVVLSEVEEVLGKDAVKKAREDAKEFSMETLDGWKNAIKAQAFVASKDAKEEPEEDFIRVETVFGKKEDSDSLWN